MSIITPDKMTIAELRHYQQTGEMPKAGKVINNTYANKFDRSTFFDTELKPIFSWVGGKGRYIKHIDHLLMRCDTYVEPFAGGLALLTHIHKTKLASKYIVNDKNDKIISLYSDIRNNLKEFCKRFMFYEVRFLEFGNRPELLATLWERDYKGPAKTRKEYYKELVKQYQANPEPALFYFLLLKSFNSFYNETQAGYAPAVGQTILDESKRLLDLHLLEKFSEMLQKAELFCGGFADLAIADNSLVYCDPPYLVRNVEYGTNQAFDMSLQKQLAEWARWLQNDKHCKVIISNNSDYNYTTEKLYKGAKITYFDATYNLRNASSGIKYTRELIAVFD